MTRTPTLSPANAIRKAAAEAYGAADILRRVRNLLGRARLTADEKAVIAKVAAEKGARARRDLYGDPLIAQATTRPLAASRRRAALLQEQGLAAGLRRSESTWVGGRHTTTAVPVDTRAEVNGIGASETVWHPTKRRSGTDSAWTFTIQADYRSRVVASGLANPEAGRLTLWAEAIGAQDGAALYGAVTVRQGRGFALVREEGVIAQRRGAVGYGKDAAAALLALFVALPDEDRIRAAADALVDAGLPDGEAAVRAIDAGRLSDAASVLAKHQHRAIARRFGIR